MALQLSVAVRTAMAGQLEATVGAAPSLVIRTSAPPANCSAADTGTALATITLPSDWLAAASGGAVALAGVWSGAIAASGDAGHFRIVQGGTCHAQGTVSQRAADGGTGDLQLDRASVALVAGDALTVTGFTYTQGNA
jgi:hypothetical protein